MPRHGLCPPPRPCLLVALSSLTALACATASSPATSSSTRSQTLSQTRSSPSAAPASSDPPVLSASLFSYPWTWTDEQGQPAPFSRWRGQPLVVTAMFTQCKATCPRTLAKLRQVFDRFQAEGRTAQFLLVTLDPDNDTPEVLRRFKAASSLPDAWHLLSGSSGDTRELRDTLDIHVIDDGPHLLHDGRIVVFDAKGVPTRSFSGWGLGEEKTL